LSGEKTGLKAFMELDAWTVLAAALAVLFILFGFLTGWAGMHSLAVYQPIFFTGLFLVVLKKNGLSKQEVLFLAVIFLFGYGIRAHNIQPGYKYFFGFDSYYHGRIVGMLIEQGSLPEIDPLAYYELPDPLRRIPTDVMLFWQICAGFYRVFTLSGPFSWELWIEIMKTLPAFYGALISVLMYFLGKELWGKKAGYMAAFTAAVIPSYVYRTMAGFLEDDALGFFWLVTGLIFLIRALKEPKLDRSHLINAALAGIFFAGMALSWGFFLLIPLLLIFFFPFCTLLYLSRSEIENPLIVAFLFLSFFFGALSLLTRVLGVLVGEGPAALIQTVSLIAFAASVAGVAYFSWKHEKDFFSLLALYVLASLVFLAIIIPFIGLGWFNTMLTYVESAIPVASEGGLPAAGLGLAFAFLIAIAGFFLYLMLFGTKNPKTRQSAVRIIVIAFLFLGTGLTFFVLSDPNGMFSSSIQTTEVFLSTVGEEGPGNPHFGYKYGILVLFAYLSLVAMPAFVFIRKKDYLTPIAFIWVALSLVMAWYKLKFTYHFGLPIAIAAGFFAGAVFFLFKDFKNVESKVGVLALAFMMLCGLAIGSYFVVQRQPSLETDPLWKNTLHWMKEPANMPEGARVMNWWSYGHWITFVAGKAVFADNRNVQWDISDGHYAKFLMSQDLEESLELIREHEPEYILVDSGLFQAFPSMAIYNFQVHSRDLDKNTYIRNLLIFAQPPRPGMVPYANFQYPCRHIADQNSYNCVVFVIPDQSFGFAKTEWNAVPSEQEQGIPVWYYREADNSAFAKVLSTVNNSTLARLWFHDPEAMEYFEEIYRASDATKTIKIFKVKKEAFGWTD